MVKEKQLRLGQIARKLNVGRNTIIEFLNKKGFEIDSNPNTKIDNDIYIILENAFEDSAVEKKVASNIKIGLEEKSNDPKDFNKKIKNEKEEIKDDKNKESKSANEIKIIKKIDLDDSGRKRVASSDQSKKKRRPRKRIVASKKTPAPNVKKSDVKENIDKKNKEIQDKIKSTLAKLSGNKETDKKRSKYRKEKRSQHAEAVEEEKIKQEEESKVLKVTEYLSANDLAKLMDVSANDVISKYLEIGMFVSINQRLDAE